MLFDCIGVVWRINVCFFFFKQKTAYEMRISDWSSDVCSSDLDEVAPSTSGLRELIASAQSEVLLQTPYLVLSPAAQDLFRELHDRDDPPRVLVSTNSLAATDAFITYALSYKYKRRYLRDFGFEIHEFKPFPGDAPIDPEATG